MESKFSDYHLQIIVIDSDERINLFRTHIIDLDSLKIGLEDHEEYNARIYSNCMET